MGVNSIGGQDLAALVRQRVADTPAPQLRSGEAAREAVAPKAAEQRPEPIEEQVQHAARISKEAPSATSSRTRLRIDDESKRIVAQILDEHDNVVKQVPPEELLRVANQVRRLAGLFFDEQT